METFEPRGGHRVPAHRGHPHRAQDPSPPARARRPRPRRRARPVVRAGPAPHPARRVQDVQGRRSRAGEPGPRGRPLVPPLARVPTSASSSSPPTCSPASRPDDLRRAFLRAVTPKPVPRIDLDHVAPIRASVNDAVDRAPRGAAAASGTITFRRLTGDLVDRLAVVVRFLAVLELFKQGFVDLDQAHSFGEIRDRLARARPLRAGGAHPGRRVRWLNRYHRGPAGRRGDPDGGRVAGRAPAAGPAPRGAAHGQVTELCRELAAEYEAEGRGLLAGQRRRGLALPEPRRPRALRRALRPRGAVGPPVGRRARDAGHRRLQAARVARPGRGDPRRQRRRRDAHAAGARVHRGDRQGSRPRARPCSSAPRPCSSSASASTASTGCPPSASSCPGPTSSSTSKPAFGPSPAPRSPSGSTSSSPGEPRSPPLARRRGVGRGPTRAAIPGRATASGCRRCSPRRASAAGGRRRS